MSDKILKKNSLADFIASLSKSAQVIGPAKAGDIIEFAPVGPGEITLDFQNSFLSPKWLFFPQSERMFEFSTAPGEQEANILKEVNPDTTPRIVVGLRPCDAKAFAVLDKIFKNDQFEDPYWMARREAATLIGLGCDQPCPTCFCTSVGAGPFHEQGLDAIAYDLGDRYLLKPLTGKGQKALDQAGGLEAAAPDDLKAAGEIKSKAEAAMAVNLTTDKIAARSVMELYDAPHWQIVQERCLNCGTCTYVCPTCHCFDIQDEVSGNIGDRVRNWDTCMSWLFTYHGSGHNPRPDKLSRVRQRFMHKFKYIPIKRDGDIGCVGCGRCVTACPVNIDVRDVIRDMNS